MRVRGHRSLLAFSRHLGSELAHAIWDSGILTREIFADGLAGVAAVGGFEEHVACEVERVRVKGREQGGFAAVGAVFLAAQRDGRYVLHLSGGPVNLRDLVSSAAVDDVSIKRVGRDVAVF